MLGFAAEKEAPGAAEDPPQGYATTDAKATIGVVYARQAYKLAATRAAVQAGPCDPPYGVYKRPFINAII